ncbi:MAG: hypothetical protein IVW57_00360 [Ktedonobacterales bacterium]|nr:hypothetical protein [Ktedonobacterales bacterium]
MSGIPANQRQARVWIEDEDLEKIQLVVAARKAAGESYSIRRFMSDAAREKLAKYDVDGMRRAAKRMMRERDSA